MTFINIYEAKTRLSKLADEAAAGTDVIVSRSGKPVARITALESSKSPIRFDVLKNRINMAEDFLTPLPEVIRAAFEGR